MCRRLRRDVVPPVEECPEEAAAALLGTRLGGGRCPIVTSDDHATAGNVRAAQEQLQHVS